MPCTAAVAQIHYDDVEIRQNVSSCVCECVCVCVCVLCWFVGGLRCSFATLLQTLASTEEASGRIFAFTAAEVTIIDAVVVLSLSLMFQNFKSDRQIVPLGAAAALFAL